MGFAKSEKDRGPLTSPHQRLRKVQEKIKEENGKNWNHQTFSCSLKPPQQHSEWGYHSSHEEVGRDKSHSYSHAERARCSWLPRYTLDLLEDPASPWQRRGQVNLQAPIPLDVRWRRAGEVGRITLWIHKTFAWGEYLLLRWAKKVFLSPCQGLYHFSPFSNLEPTKDWEEPGECPSPVAQNEWQVAHGRGRFWWNASQPNHSPGKMLTPPYVCLSLCQDISWPVRVQAKILMHCWKGTKEILI